MVKNLSAMQETQIDSWVGMIPWRGEWQPILVFLTRQFYGQRSLKGYSLWNSKEWDKLRDSHTHTHILKSNSHTCHLTNICPQPCPPYPRQLFKNVFYCDKMHMVKFIIFTILRVQFSDKYIHMVQPSPLSITRTLFTLLNYNSIPIKQ